MRFVLTLIFAVLSSVTFAEDTVYTGELVVVVKNLPKFEDYKTVIDFPKNTKIDWAHVGGWKLRGDPEFIRQTAEKKIKSGETLFAGHYAVISVGCGSPCQVNSIVDLRTGNVIGGFSSSFGALFRPDSRLIIANLWHENEDVWDKGKYIIDDPRGMGPIHRITFYELKNNQLIKLQTLDPGNLFE